MNGDEGEEMALVAERSILEIFVFFIQRKKSLRLSASLLFLFV